MLQDVGPKEFIAMSYTTVNAHQLQEALQSGKPVHVIDVRTPVEFREVHLHGAKNVPLDQISTTPHPEIPNDPAAPTYVYCRSGMRSRQACEKLTAAGYTNIFNVEGGVIACEQAGLAVERGKKAISLERQVRIAAGSLVFLGSLLAYFVHPYFLAIPAFVGAGLIFAGVTDTCGMAMVLARMPWNQVSQNAPAAR
jgi:rhodanese-related sulfurtransferase